jgi:HlyD family secretion protein
MDRKIEQKKGLRPKTIILIVAGIVLGGLLVMAILSAGTSTIRTQADKLTISEVESGSFKDYISIVGSVMPITTILLDVEEGGKVIKKVAEEGELVKKGDVIIVLENNDLNMVILNTESQLAYQSNELRNTLIGMEQQKLSNKQQLLNSDYELIRLKRHYEQNISLFEKGFISREAYLLSKENYELSMRDRELRYERMVQDSIFRENQKAQMNTSLHNMQQNLAIVHQRLENLKVKAPADGQLGSLELEIGQSINRGHRIGQLHILDAYKVTAQIDEHYIDRVRRELSATFERQDRQFDIQVMKVYPEVREGRFQVDFRFSGDIPDNLRTGQTYHLRLELGQPVEAVLLPRGGFFQSTGGQWVFVLNEAGTVATRRQIRIGRQNPVHYEVLEGLLPGERVITSSYDIFGDNERVEVR